MTLAAADGFVLSFPLVRKPIARNSSLQEINIPIRVGDEAIRRGSDEQHNMARHEEYKLLQS